MLNIPPFLGVRLWTSHVYVCDCVCDFKTTWLLLKLFDQRNRLRQSSVKRQNIALFVKQDYPGVTVLDHSPLSEGMSVFSVKTWSYLCVTHSYGHGMNILPATLLSSCLFRGLASWAQLCKGDRSGCLSPGTIKTDFVTLVKSTGLI